MHRTVQHLNLKDQHICGVGVTACISLQCREAKVQTLVEPLFKLKSSINLGARKDCFCGKISK